MLTSRTITVTWRTSRRTINCNKNQHHYSPFRTIIKIGLLREGFVYHTIRAIDRQHVAPLEFEVMQSSNSAFSSCCSAMAIARKWESWGSIRPTQLCLVTNKQPLLQNMYDSILQLTEHKWFPQFHQTMKHGISKYLRSMPISSEQHLVGGRT